MLVTARTTRIDFSEDRATVPRSSMMTASAPNGWLSELEPGGYAAPWTPASRGPRSRGTVCLILRAVRANEHPGPVGAECFGFLTRLLTAGLDGPRRR